MKNRMFVLGMLVVALAFGMMVVGCDDGSTGGSEADTWTDVTSLTQLNGTWKGTSTWSNTLNGGYNNVGAEFNNITLKGVGEITLTINASAGTMSYTEKATETFSGGNISEIWDKVKAKWLYWLDESQYTVNDKTYSLTYTETYSASISVSDYPGAQINQNGTKFKIPPPGNLSDSFVIFTKQ